MRRLLAVLTLFAWTTTASAIADGPDFWRVTGIDAGEDLNMRLGPAIQFRISATLPHDARGILNLGCFPDFNPAEWEALTKKEQSMATGMRWCRVMYKGKRGWIYARYLQEDTGE